MRVIDISMDIKKGMLVYPRNLKPEIKQSKTISKNGINQSIIKIESHTGTHVDSAYHALGKGRKLLEIPETSYFGNAIVVEPSSKGEITTNDLRNLGIKRSEIVLLKTDNSKHQYSYFRKDYTSLSVGAAEYLASIKVKAVGIDYLSIEKYGGDMSVHRALLSKGIVIYEGLMLKKVNPGRYEFFGIPLKYNGDAAPVRAFLAKVG